MLILQETNSLNHGSAVSGSTQTASAKVSCTSDQPRGLTVEQRSNHSMIWDNGEQLPRKLTIGLCAQLKILVQTHGQIKRNSAIVSQSHSTNQASAQTKEKTASVMVMSCLVLKKTQMTQPSMLNSRKLPNNLLQLMMQIELPVSLAQLQALRMLTLSQKERNNASVMRINSLLMDQVSPKSKTTGDLN